MDAFAGGEVPDRAASAFRPTGVEFAARLQMHFDAGLGGVEEGHVLPIGDRKVGIEPGIDVAQQVAVEGGRDAQGVVVGRIEYGFVLDQIDPDQQAARGIHLSGQPLEEGAGFGRAEVADAGTGIEEHAPLHR